MSSLLDEIVKAGMEMEGLEQRKKVAREAIETQEKYLKQITSQVKTRSNLIIQEANDAANKIIKSAEAVKKESDQKLTEVIAREKAVDWIKSAEIKLTDREKVCKERDKSTEKLKIEFISQKEFYVEKCKEVQSTINDIAEREAEIIRREKNVGIRKKRNKSVKKSKKANK